jgi:hypothetical protein
MGIFQPHMKMDLWGEITGFGGEGNPDPHNLDDAAYEDYYQKALAGVQNSGQGTDAMRSGIQSGVMGQLAGLDNQAAGRKKNFEEDMSRSFGNDVQQRSRAAGGTGNLSQSMNPSGSMYDAEARQTSRGYNDLYSQATKDLGSLAGIQSNFEGQDAQRAQSAANLDMNRINQRQGTANQNAANDRNSDQVGSERRIGTVKGIANIAGSMGGGGSSGFSKGGSVPKFGSGGIMSLLDPMGLMGGMTGGGGDKGGGGGGGGMASLAPLAMMAMKDGGEVPGYDSGGMMDNVMKLLPLAMMALKDGGEIEPDEDDVVSTKKLGKHPVPGKAKVKGDSPKNDFVNAKLSPEEIVLPRSVTKSTDPVRKSAQFVDETLHQGKHRHKAPNYFVGGPEVDADAGPMPDEGGEEEAPAPEGGEGGGDDAGPVKDQKKSIMDNLNGIFDNALAATASEKNAPAKAPPPLQKFAKGGMDAYARKRLKSMQKGA